MKGAVDTGDKLGFLKATVNLLKRDDLGGQFREYLRVEVLIARNVLSPPKRAAQKGKLR
jgi:hypothetical protein